MNTIIPGVVEEISELYKLPCTKERNDKIESLWIKYNMRPPTGWGGVMVGHCSFCGEAYSKHPGGYFKHEI